MSYVEFILYPPRPRMKTKRWCVRSTGNHRELGVVRWYPQWRRYVFAPFGDTVYDNECLADIGTFTHTQTRAHNIARKMAEGA